ncbi:hypothetical protein [Thalassotalea hakodatensis]|uniref:hypothetical protein n=1 Tax=Thalassotalea hakodatensis TaxID=3030492 RepID=UPI0025727714|nr:hypothetical protein [Thalassotalea hakodatensis]
MVKFLLTVFMAMLMIGCSSNYQVGDISRAYCQSENLEFRAMVKATLTSQGIKVGVDYCTIHGFVDVVRQ